VVEAVEATQMGSENLAVCRYGMLLRYGLWELGVWSLGGGGRGRVSLWLRAFPKKPF